ncbi:MAG: tryptophan 2,3-dioxygenase [Armatimonadetes bacterium]|nr:tryptophan 2,3-dioxygenase [Armatimonadota bacterium]
MSMQADGGPGVYKPAELTYNDYLKVPELLQLQVPLSDPPENDEPLFIVIHQAYELWFKIVIRELEAAIASIHRDRALQAVKMLQRVNKIMHVLIEQIHVLETMATAEFLQFRDRLNPASGFQSLQFREIEFLGGLKDMRFAEVFKNRPDYLAILQRRMDGPDLRQEFHDMLLRQERENQPLDLPEAVREDPVKAAEMEALMHIYQNPDAHLRMYLLCEALVEFDQNWTLWRQHHVLMVERVIGMRPGTGGSSGVEYLQKTTAKRFFPNLWEVRTYLTKRPNSA